VQVTPSLLYPGRQAQVKLPSVLMQVASELQPPLFVAHSLISTLRIITHRLNHAATLHGLCVVFLTFLGLQASRQRKYIVLAITVNLLSIMLLCHLLRMKYYSFYMRYTFQDVVYLNPVDLV